MHNRTMTRRALLITGGALLAAAVVVGILAVTLSPDAKDGLDVFWNTVMSGIRQPWMLSIAYALNRIGGGWIAILLVPLLIIAALLLARRWRAAVFAAVAFIACAGLTQLLKHLYGRARPDDMLVPSDFGSFPSGHTSNAAVIAVVLWLVFPRVWVALIGVAWTLLMALSRTLLAVHWATDTFGGALVGASAAFLVGAAFARWASVGWGAPSPTPRSSRAADPPLS